MGKEDIFSKLNMRDYNNKLEKIIAKKAFSIDTKNLLLSMLYKIEVGYDDYNKVKVDTKLKKDILEEVIDIIEYSCKYIELVKPESDDAKILDNEKSMVMRNERKIIVYPNEKSLLYSIYKIRRDKFEIDDKYDVSKKSMQNLLNTGNNTDINESIRDFDGWSWNIDIDNIEDLNINLIYQVIQMMVGNKFLQSWLINEKKVVEERKGERQEFEQNYMKLLKEKLIKNYEQELGEKIYKLICQIAILIYIQEDKEEKQSLIEKSENLSNELEIMENKKQYLQDLANAKKEIGRRIRQIDRSINDSKVLKEEFKKHNENVQESEKVFSLSDFSDGLQKERKQLLDELKMYSNLMEPMNYVNTKKELREKIDILIEVDLKNSNQDKVKKLNILLQKEFLKAFEESVKKAETKKEIVELIYKIRYYRFIPFEEELFVKDVEELKQDIERVEKLLITKACNYKVLNILSKNIEMNFNLISNLLNTKIIELDEIVIEFEKRDEKIVFNIYEENLIDKTIEYDNIEELNIKYNKMIKIFI